MSVAAAGSPVCSRPPPLPHGLPSVRACREVALDGLRTGVPTSLSVLLCFFFGPTGLLTHALAKLLYGGGRKRAAAR